MIIEQGRTSESAGHYHTISNPKSDYTDPAADGHRHQLSANCSACNKSRQIANNTAKALGLPTSGIVWTRPIRGHKHYINIRDLFV